MERIAIIDHEHHRLYIEDINEEILNEKYHGNEEEYIKDNYDLGTDNYTWDYIVGTEYFPDEDDQAPIDVEFSDLL